MLRVGVGEMVLFFLVEHFDVDHFSVLGASVYNILFFLFLVHGCYKVPTLILFAILKIKLENYKGLCLCNTTKGNENGAMLYLCTRRAAPRLRRLINFPYATPN